MTSLKRSPSLPDLPTVDEAGVPKFEALTWHGVVVPAATPRPLVLKINAEINQALALAEVREKLAVQGIEAQGGTPAEFAALPKKRNTEVDESRPRFRCEARVKARPSRALPQAAGARRCSPVSQRESSDARKTAISAMSAG